MAEHSEAVLQDSTHRPTTSQSNHSTESRERTPLLSRAGTTSEYGGVEMDEEDLDENDPLIPSPATASLRSLQSSRGSSKSKKNRRPWPTILAVTMLGVAVITIILGAFFAPAIVEEYAKESMVIEPKSLSIHEITPTGVSARVQASFKLDASKVKNKHVRNIGRFGTWLARKVESEKSTVEVYLPEYGNILIGTAVVPAITVDIRNGHYTIVDFLADLKPGDIDGIRRMANDWLDGRLNKLRVTGKADVGLKSGLIHLGTQTISESMVFEGQYLSNSFASFNFGEKSLA